MARRNVYPTTEIAHLWAHQTQDSARNQQGNFYFNGDTIYSYRSSWPLARLVNASNGTRAVLLNDEHYSNTTSKHLNLVGRAIPRSLSVWSVGNNVDLEPIDIFARAFTNEVRSLKQAVAEAKNKVSRAKRYIKLTQRIQYANNFAEFFGLSLRLTCGEMADMVAEVNEELAATEAKRQADVKRQRQAAKRAQRKHDLEMAEDIEAWKAGDNRGIYYASKTFLRIDGNEVETSKGARFPVRDALRGIALIRQYLGHGIDFRESSDTAPRLGYYHIDRIDAKGNVTAGCHFVEYSEIQRIAPQLEAAAQTVSEGDI